MTLKSANTFNFSILLLKPPWITQVAAPAQAQEPEVGWDLAPVGGCGLDREPGVSKGRHRFRRLQRKEEIFPCKRESNPSSRERQQWKDQVKPQSQGSDPRWYWSNFSLSKKLYWKKYVVVGFCKCKNFSFHLFPVSFLPSFCALFTFCCLSPTWTFFIPNPIRMGCWLRARGGIQVGGRPPPTC